MEPKLEEEYLKKANADIERKKKRISAEKQKNIMNDYFIPQEKENVVSNSIDNDNDEPLPLAQRIKANGLPVIKGLMKNQSKPLTTNKRSKLQKPTSPIKKVPEFFDSDSDGRLSYNFDN